MTAINHIDSVAELNDVDLASGHDKLDAQNEMKIHPACDREALTRRRIRELKPSNMGTDRKIYGSYIRKTG